MFLSRDNRESFHLSLLQNSSVYSFLRTGVYYLPNVPRGSLPVGGYQLR
jgi:hypothetical protein